MRARPGLRVADGSEPAVLLSCTNGRGFIRVRFVRYAGLKDPRKVRYTTDISLGPDTESGVQSSQEPGTET